MKPRGESASKKPLAWAKAVITEAHVQQAVREFLEWDGWRAIRTDPVSDRSRGKGFGELGMPDYLFIRYWNNCDPGTQLKWATKGRIYSPVGEILWIEFKRKGAKPKLHQQAWIDTERHHGALLMVVDDIDEFIAFYKASGLQRKR